MKLLLDQHLSFRLLDALNERYPDSEQVFKIGMSQSTDREIWEYAKQNGFIVVSKDSDFHEFSVLFGAPPKVIWLKGGNSSKQKVLDVLNDNYSVIDTFYRDEHAYCLELYF